MFACDESASIDCARLIRGIDSIAKAVTPADSSAWAISGSVSGWRKPMKACPSRRRPISSLEGGATLTTTSADQASLQRESPR